MSSLSDGNRPNLRALVLLSKWQFLEHPFADLARRHGINRQPRARHTVPHLSYVKVSQQATDLGMPSGGNRPRHYHVRNPRCDREKGALQGRHQGPLQCRNNTRVPRRQVSCSPWSSSRILALPAHWDSWSAQESIAWPKYSAGSI